MKSVYLFPGQMQVATEPSVLSTILGSCVAVALFDAKRKVGGLNHYLLPKSPDGVTGSLRYGDHSLEKMLQVMVSQGSQIADLRAKIYGGNSVLEGVTSVDVGSKNISFAREWLQGKRIPVLEEKVKGNSGCRVAFKTDDFSVQWSPIREEEKSSVAAYSAAPTPKLTKKIRVLIVDDSATVRNVFQKVLLSSGQIEVVGMAADPYQARELLVSEKPDVMLLDIEMPRMTGVDFLAKVMQHMPVPVIMVSSLGSNDGAALRCLEIGAVEFVHKPSQFDPSVLRNLADSLVTKIVHAAAQPVEKIKARARFQASTSIARPSAGGSHFLGLVLVGGNAGSQFAFQDFIRSLAQDTPPVVACIGTLAPFAEQFCKDKKNGCAVALIAPTSTVSLEMGNVYLIPVGYQPKLQTVGGRFSLQLEKASSPTYSPNLEKLWSSAADGRDCKRMACLLLSGFGRDGVDALVRLREKGAFSIVVSPESAPFSSLPEAALADGAADQTVGPSELAAALFRHRSDLAS
jgi:two-component system, chemotaxis family, protein-glutamate methylesterase/glutaminase